MSEKREARTLKQVNHIGLALLAGVGAAAGMGIKTGNLGICIAVGIAVFLVFGLELN